MLKNEEKLEKKNRMLEKWTLLGSSYTGPPPKRVLVWVEGTWPTTFRSVADPGDQPRGRWPATIPSISIDLLLCKKRHPVLSCINISIGPLKQSNFPTKRKITTNDRTGLICVETIMDANKRKFERNTSENNNITIAIVIVIILHLSYGLVRVMSSKNDSEHH